MVGWGKKERRHLYRKDCDDADTIKNKKQETKTKDLNPRGEVKSYIFFPPSGRIRDR